MRNRHFVPAHRGGPLDLARHRLLASWAADCADRVLSLFEGEEEADASRIVNIFFLATRVQRVTFTDMPRQARHSPGGFVCYAVNWLAQANGSHVGPRSDDATAGPTKESQAVDCRTNVITTRVHFSRSWGGA